MDLDEKEEMFLSRQAQTVGLDFFYRLQRLRTRRRRIFVYFKQQPDQNGYFGEFGGSFVPVNYKMFLLM